MSVLCCAPANTGIVGKIYVSFLLLVRDMSNVVLGPGSTAEICVLCGIS